jgi:predicted SAM-dependent methyltransferase
MLVERSPPGSQQEKAYVDVWLNDRQDDISVKIGCGPVYHAGRVNLDVEPTEPAVKPLDVRKAISLDDGTATAGSRSHVIEHFALQAAQAFLTETFRVLRSGDIIRSACPHLAEVA